MVVVIMMTLVYSCTASVFAQGGTVTVGLLFAEGYGQDAQLKKMVTDVITNVIGADGVVVNMKWYTDDGEFLTAVKKGTFDIVYANKHDLLPILVKKQKFTPVVTFGMFGDRENPICLFVPRSKAQSGLNALKGTDISTYYSREGYFNLRQFFDVKPDAYFSSVVPQHKGMDALKMLIEGKVGASFVLKSNYEMLKVMNPSEAAKVFPAGCTKGYYDLPIMYSSSLSPALTTKLKTRLKTVFSEPEMKQYRSLISMVKLKVVDVGATDYKPIINLYATAEKGGWEKDYQAWYAKTP